VSWIHVARDRAKQQHSNDPGVLVLTCLGGDTVDWRVVLRTVIITGACNRLISFPIFALAKQTVRIINDRQVVNFIKQ
jgi:hypothetical protein